MHKILLKTPVNKAEDCGHTRKTNKYDHQKSFIWWKIIKYFSHLWWWSI